MITSGRFALDRLPTSPTANTFLAVRTANASPIFDSIFNSDVNLIYGGGGIKNLVTSDNLNANAKYYKITDFYVYLDLAVHDLAKGKTNIIDSTKTQCLDGDVSTAPSSFVYTTSTTPVNADCGVDVGALGLYMVLAKVGSYTTSAIGGQGYIYGSADGTTYTQLAQVSLGGTATETIQYLAACPTTPYRYFKIMFNAFSSGYNAYIRTYELAVFKVA